MNSIQTRRNKENKISDLFRMKTSSPVLAEENHLKSLSPLFSHFLCLRAEAICFPLPVAANQFPKRPQQLITNSLLHSYVTWQFCLALEMRAWRRYSATWWEREAGNITGGRRTARKWSHRFMHRCHRVSGVLSVGWLSHHVHPCPALQTRFRWCSPWMISPLEAFQLYHPP